MKIVNYNHGKMIDQVITIWNDCCSCDMITKEKFLRYVVYDENFDPNLFFVATEGDNVIGFIYGYKRKYPYLDKGIEKDKAWISAMMVKKEYQRTGIGRLLISFAETELKKRGSKTIEIGANSPYYFFAGLDEDNYPDAKLFFENRGYIPYDKHYSMGRDLHLFNLSETIKKQKEHVESKGYRFVMFDSCYSVDLLEFLRNEFGGGWKFHALEAMKKGKAEERMVLVINPQGKICGCANRAIDDNEMRFGPIGISKEERNLGLGSILLNIAMLEMTKRGIYRMYFMTTDEKGKKYYERSGLKIIRTYTSYHKDI